MKATCAMYRVAALILAQAVGAAVAQPAAMPDEAALRRSMSEAQKRAGELTRKAQAAAAGSTPVQRTVPAFPVSPGGAVDVEDLVRRYSQSVQSKNQAEQAQLVIFASLSMPDDTLVRLARQARTAGGVLVLRGLKHGMRAGGWSESMNALKPIAETGVDLQIHPELFRRFAIAAVPTVVVTGSSTEGCLEDLCDGPWASVIGDVSLDYALERIARRADSLGSIARQRLKRLRNS